MAPSIDEALLDDADELLRKDSRGALRALATAGAQVREAVALADEAGIHRLGEMDRPRSVLVAALGGSALVAEVLELLAEPGSPVPVQARRNLPLPGWVGPLDLVVAVSLSGRAPGPLAVASEAARRGASLLTVAADDSPLAEVCRRARGVHVGVGRSGRTSSRTALWSLLTPVLLGADAMGLAECGARTMSEVADRLDEHAEAFRPASESFVNPAKMLAVQLAETVPVVLGDGPLGGVAAARASSMLARTARIPAPFGELPDAASQIVACFDGPYTEGARRPGTYDSDRIRLSDIDTSSWEPHHFAEPEGELMERARGPQDSGRDVFADPYLDGPSSPQLGLLLLRDAPVEPLVEGSVQAEAQALTEAVLQTAADAGVKVMQATAGAGEPLTRLADLVATVDFTATYLALGLGLDPSISPHVADLRDRTR